jgi:hypothetical protein
MGLSRHLHYVDQDILFQAQDRLAAGSEQSSIHRTAIHHVYRWIMDEVCLVVLNDAVIRINRLKRTELRFVHCGQVRKNSNQL